MFLVAGITLGALFLLPFLFGDESSDNGLSNNDAEPDIMPGPVPVDIVEILQLTPQPTPGSDYQIRKGDTLLAIAGKAFNLGPGQARLRAARAINNDPRNAAYLAPSGPNFQLIGPMGIGPAFFPKWQCGNSRQAVHTLGGSCYGVLRIPLSY